MIHETLRLVREEFRERAALGDVARLSSFHRVQCSPGFRAAAGYIHSRLTGDGIRTDIISYPARQGVRWWSQESFPEWVGRDAELVLLEGGRRERLCSYAEVKTSLIQRSASTRADGLITGLVYVEKADDPASYDGLDVSGKLVFSRGAAPEIARVAVDRFGAAGIVLDTMREHPPVRDRFDLPEARQYLSFWPADPAAHKAFGFVVTPRQGEELRRRFAAGKKELQVFARVDSEFTQGSLEVVSAVIPGESDEEVAGVAHLCHPEPSANDNASGSGTLMEAARTLSRLIESGRLPRPRRTVRFLWLPEMTGSFAFLANNEEVLNKTVAAINLDMVGENQDLCGSTFTVERQVSALPGFGGDLAASVLRLLTGEVRNYGGTHSYPSFRWTVSPYSGGSDHNIWGDPSVGVTCPMLIQWPDKFYHTSEDTPDKVDPRMLGVAGVVTAAYLYAAAAASPADAAYVAREMAAAFGSEGADTVRYLVERAGASIAGASSDDQRTATAKARRTIERRVRFLAARRQADVESLKRLAPDSPLFAAARESARRSIESTAAFLRDKGLRDLAFVAGLDDVAALPPAWESEVTDARRRAESIVPRRAFRGPFSSIAKEPPAGYEEKTKAFSAKHKGVSPPTAYLQYWADGKRSLAEIADLIEGETGLYDMYMLVEYFDLMVERGVFKT